MHSTLIPKPSDDPHDILVVAPNDVRVAPADEELSNLLHQAARYRLDAQARAASDVPAGPTVPPVDTMFRPAAVNDVLVPGKNWSMARRAGRGFIALLLASCVGLAAVAWKAYGDEAKRKIAKLATQLVLTVSQPPENPARAAQPAPPDAQAANAAPPQPAPPAQTSAEAAAASPDQAQLLQSMARDLASVGQEIEQLKASIEQLKASQQLISRDVAKASEQNLRPRISAPLPRPAVARAHKPVPPQAAAAPTLPQSAASQGAAPYVPRQPEPPPQTTDQPQPDPELSSVPRPPMPVR